jgi:hypothetical protein
MPPLGLWLPFPLYYEAHRKHHQNTHLTEPGVDTESFYVRRADWAAMPAARKALHLANQTLAGRVLLGPLLRLEKLARLESAPATARLLARAALDRARRARRRALLVHLGRRRRVDQYVLLMAWPAFGLGWVRSFIEHRYGARPGRRTAITESARSGASSSSTTTSRRAPPAPEDGLVAAAGLLAREPRTAARAQRRLLPFGLRRDRAPLALRAGVRAGPSALVA